MWLPYLLDNKLSFRYITKSLKIPFIKTYQMSTLLNLQVSLSACLCLYAPMHETAASPLPSTIIPRHRAYSLQMTWIKQHH